QPVGGVDEILVLEHPPTDLGTEPVVATRDVRARVMHAVGDGLGGGAARREVAVAERTQGLAHTLARRIVAVVDELPADHRASSAAAERPPSDALVMIASRSARLYIVFAALTVAPPGGRSARSRRASSPRRRPRLRAARRHVRCDRRQPRA